MGNSAYIEDLMLSGKHAGDIFNIQIQNKTGEYLLLPDGSSRLFIKDIDAIEQLLVPNLTILYENEETSESDSEDFEKIIY